MDDNKRRVSPPTPGGQVYSKEEKKRVRERNGLLRITIETSKICNLKCRYCYANAGHPHPKELSYDEITSVIEQAKALGARSVILIGGGEPLMYRGYFDLVDYINDNGMIASSFTNCTLITKETAKRLYEKEVTITGKLNSFDEKKQDHMVGVKGASEKIWEGIQNLIDVGYTRQNPSMLTIHSIICRQNYDEIPIMFIWMRENNIIPHLQVVTSVNRAYENELDIENERVKELFYHLLDIDERRFGYTWTPQPPLVGWTCAQYFYSCFVTSQGFVKPCSSVDIHVGNIRMSPLKDILNTQLFRMFRGMTNNITGQCRSCKYNKEGCYGCRGNAYGYTGDPFASDPTCWRIYSRKGGTLRNKDEFCS